jgi:UDP-glucose 4-epimerase
VRVLITGGAGFIGSHLADRLLGEGHRVQVLDDLSTGRLANIAHLLSDPGFENRIGSVTDETVVRELVGRADLVCHLAAVVGVQLVARHPVRAIETNVRGTELVLRAAAETGCQVLIASSSEVYGAGPVPFSEDDPVALGVTSRPRGGYACSKALGEWLALAQHRERDLAVVVVRVFNTVGPRQSGRYGMVLPRFASQALRGEPITVYGDGCQTRCFAHVLDVVEALCALIHSPSANGRVFNVGSDREVSVRELAELVRERAGSPSRIAEIPYEEVFPQGFVDLPRRVPDLTRLESTTGTRPSTPLETIVDDVVAGARLALARQA